MLVNNRPENVQKNFFWTFPARQCLAGKIRAQKKSRAGKILPRKSRAKKNRAGKSLAGKSCAE